MNIDDPRLRATALSSANRMELWSWFVDATAAKHVAEVGVWQGQFAEQILARCQAVERYTMVDPWAHLPDWNKPLNVVPQRFEGVYREAMARTAFAAEKVVVLRGRTSEVVDRIPDNSLDFVYIDGDHTLRGIAIDLIRLLPKIKENGFLAGDDFSANVWQPDARFEPTLVCPFAVYFAEAMKLPFLALPFDQFLIQKRSAGGFSFDDPTGTYRDLSLRQLSRRPWRARLRNALRRLRGRFGS